eukprot:3090903-Rhodomonas_salina.1
MLAVICWERPFVRGVLPASEDKLGLGMRTEDMEKGITALQCRARQNRRCHPSQPIEAIPLVCPQHQLQTTFSPPDSTCSTKLFQNSPGNNQCKPYSGACDVSTAHRTEARKWGYYLSIEKILLIPADPHARIVDTTLFVFSRSVLRLHAEAT